MTEAGAVVDVQAAAFGYAGRAVVSAIDLRIFAGESIALLGPNGSGKSTLVKGLLGLTAVSYTHLDVYKRQALDAALPFAGVTVVLLPWSDERARHRLSLIHI